MDMEGTNILILNPLYEKSHTYYNENTAVQYHHGDFTTTGEIISIAFFSVWLVSIFIMTNVITK